MSSPTDSLVPEAFIDPITQDIFTDPVVTSDLGRAHVLALRHRALAHLPQHQPRKWRHPPILLDKRLAPNIALRKAAI